MEIYRSHLNHITEELHYIASFQYICMRVTELSIPGICYLHQAFATLITPICFPHKYFLWNIGCMCSALSLFIRNIYIFGHSGDQNMCLIHIWYSTTASNLSFNTTHRTLGIFLSNKSNAIIFSRIFDILSQFLKTLQSHEMGEMGVFLFYHKCLSITTRFMLIKRAFGNTWKKHLEGTVCQGSQEYNTETFNSILWFPGRGEGGGWIHLQWPMS